MKIQDLTYKPESQDGVAFLMGFYIPVVTSTLTNGLLTLVQTPENFEILLKLGCCLGILFGFLAIFVNRQFDEHTFYLEKVEFLIDNFNELELSESIKQYNILRTKIVSNKLWVLSGMINQKLLT